AGWCCGSRCENPASQHTVDLAMRSCSKRIGSVVGILGLMLSASASAAVITWGPAQDSSGPGDVTTNGTVVEAINLTSDVSVPGGPTLVNGVSFTWDNTIMGLAGGTGMLFGGDPGDPGGYNTILDSVDHGDSSIANPWPIQVGGGGLTVGNDYEIQLWYTDNRGFTDPTWSQTFDDGNGNTVSLLSQGSNLFGQFVLGTFTADGTSQTLEITGGGPPGEPHLNAYKILGNIGNPLSPGDVNGDTMVDELDLEVILGNFFVTDPEPTRMQGNLNFDGTVNELDFLLWRNDFLDGGGSLEGLNISFPANVPEPSTVVLMAIGLMALVRLRRRSGVVA
ncbi:MAG: PEP-CTERM sorting domain-containing protein, partial [Aeoliella sp.]